MPTATPIKVATAVMVPVIASVGISQLHADARNENSVIKAGTTMINSHFKNV